MGRRDTKRGTAPRPSRASTAAPALTPVAWLSLGAVFLVVAAGASLALALQHVGGLSLPGCGPGSACAELARSRWGRVPGINWPVSFVGLAYFLAALPVWFGARRGVPTVVRCVARLSVLASLIFTAVMLVEKHLCPYCVAVHLANVAFWLVIESSRRSAPLARRTLATGLATFAVVSLALGVVETSVRRVVTERAEQQRGESAAQIIAQSAETRPATARSTPADVATSPTTTAAAEPAAIGFRGRYLLGPDAAAVRIVVFTDYQCRDCRAKEAEIRTLLARHQDISLSVKQFPFDQSCNPRVDRTLHENACWAARAAEAAGILWGDAGFFAMHHWLFDHEGRFLTTQELEDGIRSIGYDPAGFVQVMTGPETLARVQADIEEAHVVGLFQTPMIFINGVELRGWNAPNAVIRTVEEVLARHPAPQTHAHDRPPLAVEKCVGDWREQPVLPLPPDTTRWPLGPDDARVHIVMFGDYQEPNTAKADELIRGWLSGRADAQYVFRHFPFDQACNPNVPRTQHPRACWAARVAEAAGRVGGSDEYWRMHTWLLGHPQALSEEALRAAGGEIGLDIPAILSAAEQPEALAAVREDADAAKRMNFNGIPTILINGKLVIRWLHLGPEQGRAILTAILDAAAL